MKSQLKYLFMALAVVFGLSLTVVACSDDDDDDLSSVSPEFTAALIKAYPFAKNVEWESNGTYRVADFMHQGVDYDIWFDNSAKIVMHELDFGINLNSIPNPEVARKFMESQYANGTWTLDDVKYYKQLTDEFYVFEVESIGVPDLDIYYDVQGNIIKTINSDVAPAIRPDTSIR